MMHRLYNPSPIEHLWGSAPSSGLIFDPDDRKVRVLPHAARQYLEHAMDVGTPLASAVRLRMHGEFRQKDWYPFTAEQIIRSDGQMLWQARIRLHGLPVTGFDSVLAGKGKMQWKLFGILPLVNATGPDITRSAIGRLAGESIWLPSLLCGENVAWKLSDLSSACAHISFFGEETQMTLTVSETGSLQTIAYLRWGNPDGGKFHYTPFGGIVEEEATFSGYTIPSSLRIGWYFGTPRFDTEGEFFRVTIDEAIYL